MSVLKKEIEKIFTSFIDAAGASLLPILNESSDRFPSKNKLLSRYSKVITKVREKGAFFFREFHEVHNELCTAVLLLQNSSEPSIYKIEYEPSHKSCEKRFDFEVTMSEGPIRYLEVKTIHPINQNDWIKYKNAVENERFSDNTYLLFEQEWLGGELYHNAYAARSKMMDYSIVTEEKIRDCITSDDEKYTFLILYSDGFDWNSDTLEDFVYYYRNGIN